MFVNVCYFETKCRIAGIKEPLRRFFIIITDVPGKEDKFFENIRIVEYLHLFFLPR